MDLTTTSPAISSADGTGQPSQGQSQMVVDSLLKVFNAWVSLNSGSSGTIEQQVFAVDLTTARPEEQALAVPFAFRSLYLRDATDNNCFLYLKPYSMDTHEGSSKMRNKDLWESGDFPCPKAYLWWPAQSGKSITLEFHVRSRVVPGNAQVSVSNTDGSSATSFAYKSVTTTAAALLAADTDRKISTIQNQGSVSIYVGGSTVTAPSGAAPGIEILAGASLQWRNTGALYAITASVTNAAIAVMDEK